MKLIITIAFLALTLGFISTQTVNRTDIVSVPVTIYDHHKFVGLYGNPDFQPADGTYSADIVKGMVEPTLNTLPVYNRSGIAYGSNDGVNNKTTFSQWFKSVPNVNIPLIYSIPFTVTTYNGMDTKRYYYLNNAFFPIDNKGWCDPTKSYAGVNCTQSTDSKGNPHNFYFCFEWSGSFIYRSNQKFSFTGDDDVWVFFNNKLKIDIGGIHAEKTGSYSPSESDGYVLGKPYPFNFFYCERKTSGSNIMIDTNIDIIPDYYDFCGVGNGNGDCCVASRDCTKGNACTVPKCPAPNAPGVTKDNFKDHCTYTPLDCPTTRGQCYNNTCDVSLGGCPTGTQKPLCESTKFCEIKYCASAATGCSTRPRECPGADACNTVECDETQDKCVTTPIDCSGTDLCYNYGCSVSKNGCFATKKDLPAQNNNCDVVTCVDGLFFHNSIPGCSDCGSTCNQAGKNDRCKTWTCSGTQCTGTPVDIDDNNACTIDACDPATGLITHTPTTCSRLSLCHLEPTCDSATGNCVNNITKNCGDGNECTDDSCNPTDGSCVNTPRVCDDGDACTIDSCDQYTGCKATRKQCPTENLCEEGYCSAGDCKVRPLTCKSKNYCDIPLCNAKVGCVTIPRDCIASDESCSSSSCNYDTQKCEDKPYDPLPFKCQSAAVKTGVAIGSAATAGIIIAGAVALGMAVFGGKKGYDYWKQSRDTKMSAAVENPLFEASNLSKENPLFENSNA